MKMRTVALLLLLALVAVGASLYGWKSRGAFRGWQAAGGASASSLGNEPDVTFPDLQGQSVTLASLKGKVVLVNFWATWCDPCKAEIPDLMELQEKYAGKGFTVLGVAMDDDGKSVVQPYVQNTQFDVGGRSMNINYPIVLGNDDVATKFGGLFGFPVSFLISRDGKVQKKYLGELSEDEMEKEIEGLL
ncbi:MAG: TlpA disulfide reductase family protein [Candidatus Acidiferrales bacterium]